MNDVMQNRRANLRWLAGQHDGVTALSRKLGYGSASFLVQMAGPADGSSPATGKPPRNVTESTARSIESKLGLPELWLDKEHNHSAAAASTAATVTAMDEATALLSALQFVEAELATRPVDVNRKAELVLLVKMDIEQSGRLRAEWLSRMFRALLG